MARWVILNSCVLFFPGSPFLCRVTDGDEGSEGGASDAFSRVNVELDHLGQIPVHKEANFTIKVAGGDDAELAVSVQGK